MNTHNDPTQKSSQMKTDISQAISWLTIAKTVYKIPDDLIQRLSTYTVDKGSEQ